MSIDTPFGSPDDESADAADHALTPACGTETPHAGHGQAHPGPEDVEWCNGVPEADTDTDGLPASAHREIPWDFGYGIKGSACTGCGWNNGLDTTMTHARHITEDVLRPSAPRAPVAAPADSERGARVANVRARIKFDPGAERTIHRLALLGRDADFLMEEVDRLTDLATAQAERCCRHGCDGGACEQCPCCTAGRCVMGTDGLPDDSEALARWIEVASECNPVAAHLAVQAARIQAVRDLCENAGDEFVTIADGIHVPTYLVLAVLDRPRTPVNRG